MKPRTVFVAAGFVLLCACSVTTKDESADNAATENAQGTTLATDEGNDVSATVESGPSDTLGNQLDQLNGDAAAEASNDSGNQQ